MKRSEDLSLIAPALALAQGEIQNAERDSENPAFKRGNSVSRYASLASVLDAVRGPLSRNGIFYSQWPEPGADGKLWLTTLFLHASGQYIESSLPIPIGEPGSKDGGKTLVQCLGSTLTTLRRYVTCAVNGIAEADDDGNTGGVAVASASQSVSTTGTGKPLAKTKNQLGVPCPDCKCPVTGVHLDSCKAREAVSTPAPTSPAQTATSNPAPVREPAVHQIAGQSVDTRTGEIFDEETADHGEPEDEKTADELLAEYRWAPVIGACETGGFPAELTVADKQITCERVGEWFHSFMTLETAGQGDSKDGRALKLKLQKTWEAWTEWQKTNGVTSTA